MTDRKIITSFDYPPIPYRECDWSAWLDGSDVEIDVKLGDIRKAASVIQKYRV